MGRNVLSAARKADFVRRLGRRVRRFNVLAVLFAESGFTRSNFARTFRADSP